MKLRNFYTLICVVLAFVGARSQGCTVIFSVNPGASNFTLGGAVVKPVQVPLDSVNQGVVTGFQGELVTQLPGACPSDGAALAAALAGVQLATDASTGPVMVYPGNITVRDARPYCILCRISS